MSLDGVVYEVDAVLVGKRVTLRFDPAATPGHPVQVWHEGEPFGLSKPVDLYANCFVKLDRPSRTLTPDTLPPQTAPSGLKLRELHDTDDTQEKS